MTSRLNVLAISHAYPRKHATAHGIFVHRWNVGLRADGHDVHVLQLADWAPAWPLSLLDAHWRRSQQEFAGMIKERDGIVVHHPRTFIPRPSRFFPGDAWDREANALIRYCQRRSDLRSADVVIGHFMVPDGYHALRLGRALRVPVAAVAWGDDVHAWPHARPYWRDRLRQVLTEADVLIACSQRLANDANEWLDQPRSDWGIVYGGVDIEIFHPARNRMKARLESPVALIRDLPADMFVMLMVGQRVRAKGYGELLDAWQSLGDATRAWHLVAAGVDWGDIDLKAEIAQRGMSGHVHWIGPQPAESMPALLRSADAFVLPSHNEGLSLTMLEAMATGLPTIATDVGGHAEVIREASEGWLIAPRDEKQLRAALTELMGDPAERARRGRGAREAAIRIGNPTDNARRLANVLSERKAVRRRLEVSTVPGIG